MANNKSSVNFERADRHARGIFWCRSLLSNFVNHLDGMYITLKRSHYEPVVMNTIETK